jgi:hypothetical protein
MQRSPHSTLLGFDVYPCSHLDAGGIRNDHPLPRGEGGPRPAFSPAGAGRVRGHFRRQAKSLLG